MDGPRLIVEAFPGYKGEKTPRSFTLDGNTLHVVQVIDRWYTETHSFFRVEASDAEPNPPWRRLFVQLEPGEEHLHPGRARVGVPGSD